MVRFEEYFKEPELHPPELVDYVQQLELANAIFYGPAGVGKYSLILKYIRKFSDRR
jgi:replication-associated recombination protein RarA